MNRSTNGPGGKRRPRSLTCPVHGEQSDTAVTCRHLADAETNRGYRFVAPADAPYRETAWCDHCEEIRQKAGGWTREAATEADLIIVCLPCYREFLARHNLRLAAPPE